MIKRKIILTLLCLALAIPGLALADYSNSWDYSDDYRVRPPDRFIQDGLDMKVGGSWRVPGATSPYPGSSRFNLWDSSSRRLYDPKSGRERYEKRRY